MLPVAILAGGLATRLRPITEKIPKSLVEVAGKPFIFHQLNYLRKANIKRVVLLIGHLGEMIKEQVGDGEKFDLEIIYVQDGPSPLGTGGALLKALPFLGQHFFVLYGDSFLPINYALVEAAFFKSKKLALMTVMKNNNLWDKSNVIYNDGMVIKYDKDKQLDTMQYIDYGLGVLTSDVFNDIPSVVDSLSLAKTEEHSIFKDHGYIPSVVASSKAAKQSSGLNIKKLPNSSGLTASPPSSRGLTAGSRNLHTPQDLTQEETFDLSTIYNKLAQNNQLVGYEVFERFYEIGSIKGLTETEKYLSGLSLKEDK